MKRIKQFFGKFTAIIVLLLISVTFYPVFKHQTLQPPLPPITPKKYTIIEKRQMLMELGVELKNYGLRISPSKFADISLIVLYSESGLNPKAKSSDGSQGINQLTPDTRKRLGIPSNILTDDFPTQLTYFKSYLISTGKIKQIDDSVTLHILNFAPAAPLKRDSICSAKGGLASLDLNQNGHIDREDFLKFQRQRTSENKAVKTIFEKHYGQP